jgi:hypothetical protein
MMMMILLENNLTNREGDRRLALKPSGNYMYVGICGGQSGPGIGFLRVLRFSPVNTSFHCRCPNSYHLGNA